MATAFFATIRANLHTAADIEIIVVGNFEGLQRNQSDLIPNSILCSRPAIDDASSYECCTNLIKSHWLLNQLNFPLERNHDHYERNWMQMSMQLNDYWSWKMNRIGFHHSLWSMRKESNQTGGWRSPSSYKTEWLSQVWRRSHCCRLIECFHPLCLNKSSRERWRRIASKNLLSNIIHKSIARGTIGKNKFRIL